MVERSVTAIIPTMWKSKNIYKILTDLYSWHLIDKVILIDNDTENTPDDLPKDDKLIYVKPNKNMYVNPAWNLGVHMANTDNIFLLNDDIVFEHSEVHNYLMEVTGKGDIKFEDLGFVGMHSINFVGGGRQIVIEPYDKYTNVGGWGCLFSFHKTNWKPIPNQLKIWYGDNWIHTTNESILQLRGIEIETLMSTSSDLEEVREVRDRDTIEWMKLINQK